MTTPQFPDNLRLQLCALTRDRRTTRFVDGGWWPRTRNLVVELPGLLAALDSAGYDDVHRVAFNPTAWEPAARRLVIAGRQIKAGAYHTQPEALISLTTGSGRNDIDLVVIPADTDVGAARRAMDMASDEADGHRAREIIELARSARGSASTAPRRR